MRIRQTLALLTAAGVGLAACGDRVEMPLGTTVTHTPGASLSLQVSDTSGTTTPVYDWAGPNARQLVVFRTSDGVQMWRIEAVDAGEGFAGPVQHGEVPPGANQVQGATFLTDSVEFSLSVTTVDGQQAQLRFTF